MFELGKVNFFWDKGRITISEKSEKGLLKKSYHVLENDIVSWFYTHNDRVANKFCELFFNINIIANLICI